MSFRDAWVSTAGVEVKRDDGVARPRMSRGPWRLHGAVVTHSSIIRFVVANPGRAL